MDFLKLLFGHKGRIGRLDFAIGYFSIVFYMMALSKLGLSGSGVLIAVLPAIYPSIVIPMKRFHDFGKSAWWLLLLCVPVVNFILVLVLFLKSGDSGNNHYGFQPRSVLYSHKK